MCPSVARSDVTGLGRFATAYHLRTPAGQRFCTPVLDAASRPFFARTCAALGIEPSGAEQQPAAREQRCSDMAHAATGKMLDPADDFDPVSAVDEAREDGIEAVFVHVPCDAGHPAVAERLRAAGAILSGVFPDAIGDWYASYALLATAEMRTRALRSLAVLHREHELDPGYIALLGLLLAACEPSANAEAA